MRKARRFPGVTAGPDRTGGAVPGGMARHGVAGASQIVMARLYRVIGPGTRGAFGEGGSDVTARRLVSRGRAAPDGPVEPGHDECGTIDALAALGRDRCGTINALATPGRDGYGKFGALAALGRDRCGTIDVLGTLS